MTLDDLFASLQSQDLEVVHIAQVDRRWQVVLARFGDDTYVAYGPTLALAITNAIAAPPYSAKFLDQVLREKADRQANPTCALDDALTDLLSNLLPSVSMPNSPPKFKLKGSSQ